MHLQWDIAKTKAKLILKAKISTILSPKWSTLNDMNNVYNSSLGVPYVSKILNDKRLHEGTYSTDI